ncbi:MAG: hypothetical protein ACRD0K_26935 [Egibacteraceae bacterium]
MVGQTEDRWVARVTPAATADALLAMPLGLDVWERQGEVLVVAASEAQLSELERRRLARVERLSTVEEFQRHSGGQTPGRGHEGAAPL